MKASFVRYQWENTARSIATFYFHPQSVYRYEAGQYAIISVPHAGADNRGTQRTMTLSSSPDDELLAFTMRIYQDGSSFKHALLALAYGDEITIFESLGDLVLPLEQTDVPANLKTPLVFIAGGVGIASFTGMTKWLTDHLDSRLIQLYYVVARPEDIVLQTVFENYADNFPEHLTHIIYTPNVNRLTAVAILDTAQPDSLFYLSGTEKLVESLRAGLIEGGVPRGRIVFDYFDGYSEL